MRAGKFDGMPVELRSRSASSSRKQILYGPRNFDVEIRVDGAYFRCNRHNRKTYLRESYDKSVIFRYASPSVRASVGF